MKLPLILAALLLVAAPAQAHKLKVFATAEGAVIVGTVYFSGGDKAMAVAGVVTGPDGTVAGRVITDRDGIFRFTAHSRMDHTITMDAGDGHMATTVIAAAELPPSLPQEQVGGPQEQVGGPQEQVGWPQEQVGWPQEQVGGATPPPARQTAAGEAITPETVETAVARQIGPLRRQLDAYEDQVRLHDILGGIGIIFGLFGTAAWLSVRRQTP